MSTEETRLTIDRRVAVEKLYLKRIAPKVGELAVIDDQIRALLRKIISKRRLTPKSLSEYKEMIERYPHILLEEYPRENKIKGKSLAEKAKELKQRRTATEKEIEKKVLVIERMLRAKIDETGVTYLPDTSRIPEIDLIEPVQYYASEQDNLKQSYSLKTVKGFQDIKGYTRRRFLKDRYLSIKIDLRYDKKVISEHCEKAVEIAQKAIGKTEGKGKRGKDADTLLIEELFFNLFSGYAIEENCSKETALDKTQNDLEEMGINIKKETLNRNYYPYVKTLLGAKNFKEYVVKVKAMNASRGDG
jgi:hypothetical protein